MKPVQPEIEQAPEDATDKAREKERFEPGSSPQTEPRPPASRERSGVALPGSPNEDLKGPKPGRGPRGAGT